MVDSTESEAEITPPPVKRLLAAFTGVAMMIGVLGAGIGLPVTAVASNAADDGLSAFTDLPSNLGTLNLPETSYIEAADGTVLAQFYDQDRVPVPLKSISPNMQRAIVSIEDERFFDHGALDMRGVLRALASDAGGSSTQGASTLTQQFVKNVLLEQAYLQDNKQGQQAAVEQTAGRKMRELRYAMAVEQKLSKREILEGYLNIAFFGQQSYGVQAAAQRYFGTDAADLSVPQAAMLAGIVKNPSAYDPSLHPKAAKTRRDTVLGNMLRTGAITSEQYSAARKTPIKVTGHPRPNGCASSGSNGFFCEYVVNSIINDNQYSALGKTRAERRRTLLTGGLRIHTPLNLAAQRQAVKVLNAKVPAENPNGLASSAVTVEPRTGQVKVMAQDRKYDVSGESPGGTSINYNVDQSLGGSQGFQVGSTFKSFTLADWFKNSHSASEVVNATKRGFRFPEFQSCGRKLKGTWYEPGNSEGHEGGNMTVNAATLNSVNVAYVEMETRLDLCEIAKTAESMGVRLGAPAHQCDHNAPRDTELPTCLPSLTLGVTNVAPLRMASAYATFANGGTYCRPMPVTRINSASRAQDIKYSASCKQVLEPRVAGQVNTALKQVLTAGTAKGVGSLGRPAAGKTGTTDGPYDTWFVGYTRQLSTAVWFGDPGRMVNGRYSRHILRNINTGAGYFPIVYGASVAAPIWKGVTQGATKGLPVEPLP